MTSTKQQTRFEKLAKVTKVLDSMTSAIAKDHPLTKAQQVGMSVAIGEVQKALNQLHMWSGLS